MTEIDKRRVDRIIRFALREDVWTGDITGQSVLDRFLDADGVIISRQEGSVCGIDIVERVFAAVDCALKFRPAVKDGDTIAPSQEIAFVEGNAQAILKAERTALNFLGFLSGVATATKKMVDSVAGTGVMIYDTRKTIPLYRYLQKYAVTVGGGYNHRKGLWDMVLIKDNHIRAAAMQMKTTDTSVVVKELIRRARASVQKNVKVEIEVETLAEFDSALSEKPDVIMLDNMTPSTIKQAVERRDTAGKKESVLLEVSGGITPRNVAEYASTGVDIISSGYMTAAVKPVDFSMEIIYKDI
jgi:nicotinate-nucleotide pyrophosphorylase (carboxylating)